MSTMGMAAVVMVSAVVTPAVVTPAMTCVTAMMGPTMPEPFSLGRTNHKQ